MLVRKLTAKNQVSLPQEVREALSVKAGDRIEFVVDKEGVRVVRFEEDDWAYMGAVQSTLSEWMQEEDDIYNEL